MNSNLINQIVRNNISKPNMINRTTHAVRSNMGNMGGSNPLQPPLPTLAEESGKVEFNNLAPIRQFKSLEKKKMAEDLAAELSKHAKETAQAKQLQAEKQAEVESRKRTARPPEHGGSKLLQAVMALSDKSVNNLKVLSKKGMDTGLQYSKAKPWRRNGSVLSGSSSRYQRRYRHRLHSQMFHNTIHQFSTDSYSSSRNVKFEPPRNQQMHSSWAKSINFEKSNTTNKALMPVDKGVRNLISVSAGSSAKDPDPMYNWNHPPSPQDYEIDLERIIEKVPNARQVKIGRLRLLQKHSAWENHLSAMKNMDAAQTFTKLANGVKGYLPTDDPNCILDKPSKRDLTVPTAPKTQEEIDAHIRKCDEIDSIKRFKRYGPNPNTLPHVRTIPWPTSQKKKELLRLPKWEPGSRYLHNYGMQAEEVE